MGKCSNCGETGHNKRTCSLLKENKVVEEVKVVLDETDDWWQSVECRRLAARTPAELAAATEERRRRWNRVCTRSVKLGKTQERTTERKTEQITFANGKTLDIDLG
jgi:hypothetical protein